MLCDATSPKPTVVTAMIVQYSAATYWSHGGRSATAACSGPIHVSSHASATAAPSCRSQ